MSKSQSKSPIAIVEQALKTQKSKTRKQKFAYSVPSLWISDRGVPRRIKVNPFDFFLDAIKKVKAATPPKPGKHTGGEWSKEAVIYNMFVRTTSAFDHNGNGELDLPVNKDGFRETGTFLKAIAMLPYIKKLGANTVHVLPITSIGHDGNKGNLGSPYAIRNPYELDENQSEPCLGLDAKMEFKAFVEAAHRMGFRVVVEFAFRTAAKDSDWVKQHPEWMYWIKETVQGRHPSEMDETKYGSPIFTQEELDRIHLDVREHRFGNLTPPHQIYKNLFTAPPPSSSVKKEDGRYIGTLADGTRVKIPGAFADWPPDDNQPPWGDVTYLRLYDHPDFNYIAYNTIRMYDSRLASPGNINKPLWDKIIGIIPYYQKEFHIDGVMIDMGHALPMDLKAKMVKAARDLNPDFAFWDENFAITEKSREEGYNAVFGFLWVDEHHRDRMKKFVHRAATEGFPIPFFATPENHNTPRAAARPGGLTYAKWAVVVNSFLPGIPFIHSGYEIGETYPVNTGLDFTNEDLKRLPSEKLPLFSEYAYDWLNSKQFSGWVKQVLAIRKKHADLIAQQRAASFAELQDQNPRILAFARISDSGKKRVAVVGNANFAGQERATLRLGTAKSSVMDLLAKKKIAVKDGQISVVLQPGQCIVFEY